MAIPSIASSQAISPVASVPAAGIQTSPAARGVTSVAPDLPRSGSRLADTAQKSGGLPRATVAFLESMQAIRKNSSLLSSLVSPPASTLSSLSLQSPALRPTAAMLQSVQALGQNSALLSGLPGAGPAAGPLGPLPSMATRVNAAFGNPPEQSRLAEQIISANATRKPSAEGNRSALQAYIQELQAQLGSGPQQLGAGWPREWFA